MKHDWRELDWREKNHPLGPETRQCRNCGVVQEMSREHSWGRVISRRWLPLVGRCKGADRVPTPDDIVLKNKQRE